jgi:lipopolysaccharide transport system permease protein
MKSTTDLPVTIYSPEAGLHSPRALVRGLLRDLVSPSCRDLAWRLLVRNISAQFRQSIMGVFWLFIPPVIQALVWVFLNQQQVIDLGETDIPYPLFVMAGQLIFLGFAQSLTAPIQAVNQSRSILTKINFPREALLITGFAQLLVNVMIPLIVIFPVMWVTNTPITGSILLFPFSMMLTVLFGFTLGLLVTPFCLFFTDFTQAIPIAARFLFFLTPVIYPLPTEGLISTLNHINPLTPFLVVTRDLLTGMPDQMLGYYAGLTAATFVLLFVGLVMYRLAMPHVVERMSA